MVDRGGTAQQLAVALAGVALAVAVTSCSGSSPQATASGGSTEPSGSASASTAIGASSSPAAAARWTATGSLADARPLHTATLLKDGRVLVAGGVDPATGGKLDVVASAELYDPGTGKWTLTGALNDGRYGHTATLLNDGRVLVAGGVGADRLLASAELYDPATGLWTYTGLMLEARISHTATLLPDGTVLVAGFFTGDSEGAHSLASAELFDPATGSWTATASMTQARGMHAATLLQNGLVLVTAGTAATPSGELYDPVTKTWSVTGPMLEGGTGQTATLLPDGTVLVTGQSGQLYDPTTNSWSPIAPMVATDPIGYGGTATLLPDGTVVVIGGNNQNGDGVAAAQLYDPSTGSWTATAPMPEGRQEHSATLLLDGAVLVAGGAKTAYAYAPDDLLPSAVLYYPSGFVP